jgi:hypothetical protein
MAERMMDGRSFSQDEAEEILQRAARLGARPGAYGSELNLSDLKKIAADAGIDPRQIDRAIAELEAQPSWAERFFLGGPIALQLERTVPVDVKPEVFEQLLPEIQHVLGDVGTASMLGSTFTWTSANMHGGAPTQVTVSRRDGEVEIRATSRLGQLAGGLLGGIGGGVGGGFAPGGAMAIYHVTQSAPLAAAGVLGVVTGAWLLARTIFGLISRSKERKLHKLVDRIAERLAANRAD